MNRRMFFGVIAGAPITAAAVITAKPEPDPPHVVLPAAVMPGQKITIANLGNNKLTVYQ